MQTESHQRYMKLALELAERGRYTVSPNPLVGCVLVKDNEIVGTGYHIAAGGAHAEVAALEAAGTKAAGATAYVTLEPCCHHGRTPPCTQALQAAGIGAVYVATLDPNPLVAGKGLAALHAAGIPTYLGLCEAEAERLNDIFFYAMRHQRPFIIAKWAMSLDGKMITSAQDSRAISGSDSIESAHAIRQQVDAILIGANTARADNPLLTVRHLPQTAAFVKHPLRIILSSDAHLPLDLHLFDQKNPGKTLVVTTTLANATQCENLRAKNVEVLILPHTQEGLVDLTHLVTALWQRGITSLLVEGGAKIHAAFFAAQWVNKIETYIAPLIIGDLAKKQPVNITALKQMGSDFHFSACYED